MRPYKGYSSRASLHGATRPIALTPPMAPMHFDALRGPGHHTPEEIENASVPNGKPPRRDEKILRNFDLLLPKFHFILPKFHFPAPWRKFVSSLEISDFFRRDVEELIVYRASTLKKRRKRHGAQGLFCYLCGVWLVSRTILFS